MTAVDLDGVLRWFRWLSETPRVSGTERAISDAILALVRGWGLEPEQDDAANLVIRKPGSAGREQLPPLALQAHLDMVGAAAPGVEHDFAADPIRIVVEGDVLRAEGTTLGADDGIGVALALAILESEEVAHPPLEVVLTTGEEVGLIGAAALAPGLLEARELLNLDGESWGVFLTSCAGGRTFDLALDLGEAEPVESAWELRLGGLRGGHSGLDIDAGRVAALPAVAGLLAGVEGVRLGALEAPGAFNAISREARVVVAGASELEASVREWAALIQAREPGAEIELTPAADARCWLAEASARLLDLVAALPHGVLSHSTELEGVVESSLNTAKACVEGDRATVTCSIRSMSAARDAELREAIDAAARAAGASVREYGSYPAWEFEAGNPLLARAERCFEERFGEAPTVTGVHGGLECAVLKASYPEVSMLSIGPQLDDCHTPSERASLASIGRHAELVLAILDAS